MGLVDYHTHTYLCEHASGSVDDYIREAIKANFLEIGFSDHAPLPSGLREGVTMSPEQVEYYINLLEHKRDIYKYQIDIKIGFEVDYPLKESFDKRYLTDKKLDYLIGSCHFLGDWSFDRSCYSYEFENRDIDNVYCEYYNIVSDIVTSGYFDIIGHFDLIKKFGYRAKRDFRKSIEILAKIISKNVITVEINTSGLRKPVNEIYPSDDIIGIFYNMNVPVTLGSDSHAPEEVGYMFHKAVEKVKKAGYKMISGFYRRRRYNIHI